MSTATLSESSLPPLRSARASNTRHFPILPPWLLLVIAVSFLALTLSLLLATPSSSHPCPYADVLGLDTPHSSHQHPIAAVRAIPAGHQPVSGMNEDDCPHLAIERLTARRRQESEERRKRAELGMKTEEDERLERREREEEDLMRQLEE